MTQQAHGKKFVFVIKYFSCNKSSEKIRKKVKFIKILCQKVNDTNQVFILIFYSSYNILPVSISK